MGHTQRDILLDICSDFLLPGLVRFLLLLVVTLVSLVIGIGKPETFVVTIIVILVSVVLAIRNDNKLLKALREQNTVSMQADYDSILEKLNENTYRYYGKN